MYGIILLALLSTGLYLSGCSGQRPPDQQMNESDYRNCSLQIECPGNASYYIISFDNQGAGTVNFCFEKRDTINYVSGKNDSIMKILTFQLSEVDKKQTDSLLTKIQSLKHINKTVPHDTFRYILKLDNTVSFEGSNAEADLFKLLKIVTDNFATEIRKYDYCGFFEVFLNRQSTP